MATRAYAIVHYHEIGLKGRNRSTFENILLRNLRTALTGTGAGNPRKLRGRDTAMGAGDAHPKPAEGMMAYEYDYEGSSVASVVHVLKDNSFAKEPVRVFRTGDYADTIAICPDRRAAQRVIDALTSYEKACQTH